MAEYEEWRHRLVDEDDWLGNEGVVSFGLVQSTRGTDKPVKAICDPNHHLHRVVILVFMCLLGFGEIKLLQRPH